MHASTCSCAREPSSTLPLLLLPPRSLPASRRPVSCRSPLLFILFVLLNLVVLVVLDLVGVLLPFSVFLLVLVLCARRG